MPEQSWTEVGAVYSRWLRTRGPSTRSVGAMKKRHQALIVEEQFKTNG